MMACVKSMPRLLTSGSKLQLLMMVMVVMASPMLASSADPSPLREKVFGRLPLNDVVFTGDLLQEVSARSRIDCSKKCVEREGCVMCTFHSSPEGPSPGLCRLHSQLKENTDDKQSRSGARSMAYRRHCDEGYVQECDRCLKAVAVKVIYTTARQQCGEMGGRLVVTKSIEEVECMWSFASKSGLTDAWVGVDSLGRPGPFRWNDGTLLPDDSPLWASSNPDYSPRDEACVRIQPSRDQRCYDTSCGDQRNYICQKSYQ